MRRSTLLLVFACAAALALACQPKDKEAPPPKSETATRPAPATTDAQTAQTTPPADTSTSVATTDATAATANAGKDTRQASNTTEHPRPEPGPMPRFTPPKPDVFKLSNGLTVWHVQQAIPLVTMKLVIPYGATSVPKDQAGLARFTAGMLDEGTTSRNALELSDAVDILGATLSTGADRDLSSMYLEVLARNLDPAMALMSDVLLNPAFEPKEFDRVKTLWLSGLKQRRDEPRQVARLVGSRLFFGEAHPYAHSSRGYESTISALTLEQVKTFHKTYWTPNKATMIVVGSVDRATLEGKLNTYFGADVWNPAPSDLPVVVPPAAEAKPVQRVAIVDKPGAPQTVIRFIFAGPPRTTPDHAQLVLFNTLFGGSFTSRLNQNLREKNGYTYGAGSAFSFLRGEGIFIATSNVRTEVTGASLKEFLKEFERINAGDIKPDELERARASEKSDVVQAHETQGGILGTLSSFVIAGLPPTATEAKLAAWESTTVEQLNALAKKVAPLNQSTLVMVGDKTQILAQIKDLGLPEPAFYNHEGEPLQEDVPKPK